MLTEYRHAIREGRLSLRQVVCNDPRGRSWHAGLDEERTSGPAPSLPWLRLLNRPRTVPVPACIRTLREDAEDEIRGIVLTADGGECYSVGRYFLGWNLIAGTSQLAGKVNGNPSALAVTPDGRFALIGGSSTWVQDVATGKWFDLSTGKGRALRAPGGVQENPPEEERSALWLWDLESGKCLKSLQGGIKPIVGVAMTPDAKRGLASGAPGIVEVWDLERGVCEGQVGLDQETLESCMREIGDLNKEMGSEGESGPTDGDIDAGDAKPNAPISLDDVYKSLKRAARKQMLSQAGRAVAITADGRLGVTAGYGKTVDVWVLGSRERCASLAGHRDVITALAVTPDGRLAVSASSGESDIRVWDLANRRCLHVLETPCTGCDGLAVTADGTWALSAGTDGLLRVWDLASGRCIKELGLPGESISAMAMTPDGWRVATAQRGMLSPVSTIRLWDVTAAQAEQEVPPHSGPVWALAISPDGRLLASGGEDGRVCLWDLREARRTKTLEGHEGRISEVWFAPDGGQVHSLGGGRSARRWDVSSGSCLDERHWDVDVHGGKIVTPDGKRAVVGFGLPKDSISVLDAETGQRLHALSPKDDQCICTLALSGDGRLLATSNESHDLRVWDLESARCLHTFQEETRPVSAKRLAFSGDGSLLLSDDKVPGSPYGLFVWDVASGTRIPGPEKQTILEDVPFVACKEGNWTIRVDEATGDAAIHRWPLANPELPRGCAALLRPVGDPDEASVKVAQYFSPRGRILATALNHSFLACGLDTGHVDILAFENSPLSSIIPFVTATRLWLFGGDGAGRWDDMLTAVCWWCGGRFPLEKPLPLGQDIACPFEGCGRPLRLNPFACDNKDRW